MGMESVAKLKIGDEFVVKTTKKEMKVKVI